MEDYLDPNQLLDRFSTVSALLHHEEGDREDLLKEHLELVEQAKRKGWFALQLTASPLDK
jgi:hypothetical protein